MNSNEELKLKDIYIMLREQIEHEDQLIDHRVNWLLVSQGFLLVSYTTLVNLAVKKEIPIYLIFIVAGLAILLNIFSLIGIAASFLYMTDLEKFWIQTQSTVNDQEDLIPFKKFPPLLGKTKYQIINGGFGSTLTPIVFSIAWILLLINLRI